MTTSVKKHVIGTQSAPGNMEIYNSHGKFYVTYVAPTGSNFPRTREFSTFEQADFAFRDIVAAENWHGVVPLQYQ